MVKAVEKELQRLQFGTTLRKISKRSLVVCFVCCEQFDSVFFFPFLGKFLITVFIVLIIWIKFSD